MLAPHVSDAATCLLTASGSYLFVGGSCIWLLLLSHEQQNEGLGATLGSGSFGNDPDRCWSQASAIGDHTFVVRNGGHLPLPDSIHVQSLRSPLDQKHLLAISSCGRLLLWRLDKTGLANHIIHDHPPLQACSVFCA